MGDRSYNQQPSRQSAPTETVPIRGSGGSPRLAWLASGDLLIATTVSPGLLRVPVNHQGTRQDKVLPVIN